MKLCKLLLQAFGPFTDTVLDFSLSPANFHLIYGPNEAGKSSALRAMTDLRFGIPARSADDFVHPFNQMRIAGLFTDAHGERMGFIRRKGNRGTLSLLDVTTLQPQPELPLQTQHETALTGGLTRTEFEAMFGLNHPRLREGGALLLKGEGELGSALFEASAGIRSIAAIVAELEADAKKYYSPHGAAKTAAINEAKRQLDEQRQQWRRALTKPAEWESLHRAHHTAQTALAELSHSLQTQRRLETELTELRTVEPLLRDHDRLLAECAALADAPDLSEDAREQRLSAEQAQHHAAQMLAEAEAELERCAAELQGLALAPALVQQAEWIERLAAAVKPMTHSRAAARTLRVRVAHAQAELAAAAAQIGGAAAAPHDEAASQRLLQALPSAAERADLTYQLEAIATLSERMAGLRQQAAKRQHALQQQTTAAADLSAAPARRQLATALRQAQALGDVARHSSDSQSQIRALNAQLAQALNDLHIETVAELSAMRPVLDADIAALRQQLADGEQQRRTLNDENARLHRDLAEQQLRLRQLQAAGEVVTADTLRQIRTRREAGWQAVRRTYIERHGDDPGQTQVNDFEWLQSEADRQADLLRADAKRAAGFEECATRIEQMQARQRDIAVERDNLDAQRDQRHRDWTQRLQSAGLPPLSVDALHEWQNRRLDALQLAERLDSATTAAAQLHSDAQQAAVRLSAALVAAGFPAAELPQPLPPLLEHASAWDKALTEAQAKHEERLNTARSFAAELDSLQRDIDRNTAELQQHRAAVQRWHQRLLLPPDSVPEAVKARLDELDAFARQAAALASARLELAQAQAVVDDFDADARQLAATLHEPPPPQAEDYIENLRQRLQHAKQAANQHRAVQAEAAKAAHKRQQAHAEQTVQAAVLARLCAAAGVGASAQLPQHESLAQQKRQAAAALASLRQQLRQASSRTETELRQALAGRDGLGLEAEREHCRAEITRLERAQTAARSAEESARRALEAIDASDQAAQAREAMEAAAARYRAALQPWARLRLAQALLGEALNRFRERAQAPMVATASGYFALMTGGRYPRLLADDDDGRPVLRALRADGARIGLDAMSEGTADQLYLALRLAALQLRRASHPPMPLVLDDVLLTADDQRAADSLRALAKFAEGGQVLLFTHHQHLLELARRTLPPKAWAGHRLTGGTEAPAPPPAASPAAHSAIQQQLWAD